MASYLNPKPSNSIVSDLTEIRELSNYNAKADPSLGTDAPIGAKRFVKITTGQYRWEELTSTGWVAIAPDSTSKLMHNVDMLDGYHASTSAVKNTIPVYNANALLVGGITGNAATATTLKTSRNIQLGGIVSSTTQSFNGSKDITIPINSITINNDTDNAVNGVLTPAHGGTGRNDGAAQDVRIDSLAGEVSAKTYGKIGRMNNANLNVDLNALVVPGVYRVNTENGETRNHPMSYSSSFAVLRVEQAGSFVTQEYTMYNPICAWVRRSADSGASWSGWYSMGGARGTIITLYVSKSGSDKNTGLSSDYPVLTVARAIRIAMGLSTGTPDQPVCLCIGEGDWGNVTFRRLPFALLLKPYDGTNPTAYSESLPKFGTVYSMGSYVEAYGLVADAVHCAYDGMFVISGGYKRIGALRARIGGTIYLTSQNAATNVLEMHQQSVFTDNLITAYEGGYINAQYLHIKLAENVSCSGYLLQAGGTSTISMFNGRTVFETGAYTFTGKAVQVSPSGVFYTGEADGAMTFFDQIPGNGIDIRNGAVVNGYTVGQAADDAVVHLTGNETVAGEKTFTSNPSIKRNAPQFNLIQTDTERAVAPSTTQYSQIRFLDKNSTAMGALINQQNTSGSIQSYVSAYGKSGKQANIGVTVTADDKVYGSAPSTPEHSTGVEILTADYAQRMGGLCGTAKNLGNVNVDTLLTPGIYYITGAGTNLPSGIAGYVVVLSASYVGEGVIRQLFFRTGTLGSVDHYFFSRLYAKPDFGAWVQMITSKDERLVLPGTVIAFAGNPNSAPSGYLLCNGAAVSRTTYADLFAAVGTIYGEGNGTSTFNLPDLTDRFIQGSATAGGVIDAGLPNITGEFGDYGGPVGDALYDVSVNSLFSLITGTTRYRTVGEHDTTSVDYWKFDAHEVNNIYGNADTVQPPAVTMRYYIKY